MALLDVESYYSAPLPANQQAETVIRLHRPELVGRLPQSIAIGASVAVQVNGGRWLIQCPTCNGAQLASRNDRRFFCDNCLNVDHGKQWLQVLWPAEPDNIDAVLSLRPQMYTRGWLPGETVADLVAENEQHGAPIPDGLPEADLPVVALPPVDVIPPVLDPAPADPTVTPGP